MLRQRRKSFTQAIKAVAQPLGNRPATCRKYYVHPAIIDAYREGWLLSMMHKDYKESNDSSLSLRPEERAVLGILEEYLRRENKLDKVILNAIAPKAPHKDELPYFV